MPDLTPADFTLRENDVPHDVATAQYLPVDKFGVARWESKEGAPAEPVAPGPVSPTWIYVVTEATEEMGKYAGTRWPMEGVFTRIDPMNGLTCDARSWQEGDEEGTSIHHTNDVTLTSDGAYGALAGKAVALEPATGFSFDSPLAPRPH